MRRSAIHVLACAVCSAGLALAQAEAAKAVPGIAGPPGADTLYTLGVGMAVALVISLARTMRDAKDKKLNARTLFAETAGGTVAGLVLTLAVGEFHELSFNGAVALCGIGGAFGWATLTALGAIVSGKYGIKLDTQQGEDSPAGKAGQGGGNA